MVTEGTPPEGDDTEGVDDKLGNFKKEVDRKMGNMEGAMKDLTSTSAELLKQLQAMKSAPAQAPAAQAPAQQESMEELMISNYPEYERRLKAQINEERDQEAAKRNAAIAQRNQVLTAAIQDYPELNDPTHNLTKEATKYIQSLPPEQQNDPRVYQAAIYQTAANLGIVPVAHRKKGSPEEDFQFGGKRTREPTSADLSKQKLPPDVEANARAFGLDLSDKKVVESLKRRAQRKDWMKYGGNQ